MADSLPTVVIISVSSDIGTSMAQRWLECGWQIFGTYRTPSASLASLSDSHFHLFHCDLAEIESVKNACDEIKRKCKSWDALILCPGLQDPIGSFESCQFDEWENSLRVNFTSQLRIVHELLPSRNVSASIEPCVLFFAGGGTNNAVVNYSAYTISKIALTKMCELLDAEIPDVRFVILGPGWVKTKIHESTLVAGEKSGDNYNKTIDKLSCNECTPMGDVLDCCDWILNMPRNIISGRNISVVYDEWGSKDLNDMLITDSNMYKLRRHGNDWLKRSQNR